MSFTTTTKKGFGRGKFLGFPTINMEIPKDGFFADMEEGVYACLISFLDTKYKGALYFGKVPAFDYAGKVLEVFLIDISNIEVNEGQKIQVELKKYIRGVMDFDSKEALSQQIKQDVVKIKDVLAHLT